MNKNLMIGAIVLIVLLGGGAMLMKNNKATQTPPTVMEDQQGAPAVIENEDELTQETVVDKDSDTDEDKDKENAMQKGVKTFEIDAENFKFSQTEIRVKQGDKVKIVFEVDQGFHDWVIDEFNARTKQISEGKTDSVEFVADKKGTFEFYCSVGQHRANGMVGKLIVE